MPNFTSHNFATNELVAAVTLQAVQDSIDALFPIGSYLLVHMTPPASGTLVNGAWLGCDGSAVSASTYVKLYNLIGTTYGNPGSGSFNLPDFRGRAPLSAASGGAGSATLGNSDGAALASRRPKHAHSVYSTHTHAVNQPSSSGPSAQHSHTVANATVTLSPYLHGTSSRQYGNTTGTTSGENTDHGHSISGTTTSNTTGVTAVGVSGMTDGPSYLVCCTVLIRAL